jgi:hypothetical protein
MKWPFFFKSKPKRFSAEQVDYYRDIRARGRILNMALVKELPKAAAPECGKKLGLVKAGTLILNNDDEIAILYDYCLYNYRRDGKNIIERHSLTAPPPADSLDAVLLQAMQQAYYAVLKVVDIHPNQGANLQNLITGETLDIIDISLSETGEPGIVLVGRIIPLGEFNMSSGTLIPLPESVYEDKLKPVIGKFVKSDATGEKLKLSASVEASLTAEIIRVSLHAGGEDNVFYTDIEA